MISRVFVYYLLTRARECNSLKVFHDFFGWKVHLYFRGEKNLWYKDMILTLTHSILYRVGGQNKICLFVSVKLRAKQSKNWHRRFRSFGWTEQISGGTGAQKRWKLRGNGWRVVRWQVRSVGAYRCRMIGVQSLEAAMDVGIVVDAIATAAVAAACVSASVSWM